MNKPARISLWSAALLSPPALALAAPAVAANAPPAWPLQLDSGTLGLLGAGLVALAISQRLRRRS